MWKTGTSKRDFLPLETLLCFFPEMNFPSNQLDGDDNFLLGEIRPGEGSVGLGWDGEAVTWLLRAGRDPLSPAGAGFRIAAQVGKAL